MKTHFYFILLIALSAILASCKKETKCSAGAGGNATMVVFPQHSGHTIYNLPNYPDTIFVKFNATSSPGTSPSAYDTYYVGETGEEHVHCTNLKCGDYYLYSVGFDTITHHRVTGGMPFSFSQTSGELDMNLEVTQ